MHAATQIALPSPHAVRYTHSVKIAIKRDGPSESRPFFCPPATLSAVFARPDGLPYGLDNRCGYGMTDPRRFEGTVLRRGRACYVER